MTTCTFMQAGRAAVCACIVSSLTGVSAPAWAALGDIAPAVSRVSAASETNASRLLAGGAVQVTQSVDASGTRLSEYVVTASGEIVAYTWQGPSAPNLGTLLGRYAADYQSGVVALHTSGRDGLHAARVDTPSVVVESGGLMRSYVGRAWLPAALPAGVTEGDLR